MRALWREYSADNNVDSDESAGEVDGEDMRRCNIFPPTIAYVYENTPPGSKLRAFFTDMVAENMNVLDLNEDNGEGEMGWAELLERGGDFVVDLMKALKSGNLEGREIEVKVLADKVLEENDSGELE